MRFPLVIDLRRRINGVIALLMLLHAAAATSVILVGWQWRWGGNILLIVLPLIAWSALAVLRPPVPELGELRILSREKLEGRSTDGQYLALALLPGTTAFVGLIVLRFRLEGGRQARSIVLLPAQIPDDQFRALRIWLRWEAVLGS